MRFNEVHPKQTNRQNFASFEKIGSPCGYLAESLALASAVYAATNLQKGVWRQIREPIL